MGFENYLIENVNQLHNLTVQAQQFPEQEGDKIFEATLIGCNTLQRLVSDQSFARTVEQLSDARFGEHRVGEDTFRRHDSSEFHKLVTREDSFEDFLKIEYDIMVKGGLFPDVAADLVRASRLALDRVKHRAAPASEVIEAVIKLRNQACKMGNELSDQKDEDRNWNNWKNRIERVGKALTGAALIGVNAATFLATFKSAAVAASVALGALSGELGKDFIQQAAEPEALAGTASV